MLRKSIGFAKMTFAFLRDAEVLQGAGEHFSAAALTRVERSWDFPKRVRHWSARQRRGERNAVCAGPCRIGNRWKIYVISSNPSRGIVIGRTVTRSPTKHIPTRQSIVRRHPGATEIRALSTGSLCRSRDLHLHRFLREVGGDKLCLL